MARIVDDTSELNDRKNGSVNRTVDWVTTIGLACAFSGLLLLIFIPFAGIPLAIFSLVLSFARGKTSGISLHLVRATRIISIITLVLAVILGATLISSNQESIVNNEITEDAP